MSKIRNFYAALAASNEKGGDSGFGADDSDYRGNGFGPADFAEGNLPESGVYSQDVGEEEEEEAEPIEPVEENLHSSTYASAPPQDTLVPPPRQRYSTHNLIPVAEFDFSSFEIFSQPIATQNVTIEDEEEVEPPEFLTGAPVKNDVSNPVIFSSDFSKFTVPDILQPIPCEAWVSANPVILKDSEFGEMRRYEESFSKMIAEERSKLVAYCMDVSQEYRNKACELQGALCARVINKYEEQREALKVMVGDKYPHAIGETLSADKVKMKTEELDRGMNEICEKERLELGPIHLKVNTHLSAMHASSSKYMKKMNKRIDACEKRINDIYAGIRAANAREQKEIKKKKAIKNFKNFLTPLENKYLKVEPLIIAPVRRILFSYNKTTGTHRLVEIYNWFDIRKLIGVFILMMSFLYATGYLERWFITPYNMFDQERQEYLDSNGRLVSNTLLRFGLMNPEVHQKQIAWVTTAYKVEITEKRIIEGFVPIVWSDGSLVNISIPLLEQRLSIAYATSGKDCLCAAHVGIPLNVVLVSNVMMIEPSFSTETKIYYHGEAIDMFSNVYPTLEYPLKATTVYRTSDSLQRRMETDKADNRCIVRCAQIIARKK